MTDAWLTDSDIRLLTEHGLSVARVQDQLEKFKKGASPVRLDRPATVGDGIIAIADEEREAFAQCHDREAGRGRIMKFVPASGAASRMFREWFRVLDNGGFDTESAGRAFAGDLRKMAFHDDLERLFHKRGESVSSFTDQGRYTELLADILTGKGLRYGQLPKALLKFHAGPGGSRTALEEHLVEAALYAADQRRICRVHFTVSEEHRQDVERYLSKVLKIYEEQHHVCFEIRVSVQQKYTDTLAVDMGNRPFRDDAGNLVLRPGGHGALLANIDALEDADIVFIKNIDNVVPDRLKPVTVQYKKILCGYLVTLQQRVFRELAALADGPVDASRLDTMADFCRMSLNIEFPARFDRLPAEEKISVLYEKMNRPMRVCGMVKNEGEPGGGPFWTMEKDGSRSLQIVEESQIDRNSPSQRAVWSTATHFNPVDLVCGVRDCHGRRFNLQSFVDPDTYNIAVKSEKGRDLQALELPGLWNGGMARWNTVFVEVPLETFNPVKTVYDLLRPQHQG